MPANNANKGKASPVEDKPRHELPGCLVPVPSLNQDNYEKYLQYIVRGAYISKNNKPGQFPLYLNDGLPGRRPLTLSFKVQSQFGISANMDDENADQEGPTTANQPKKKSYVSYGLSAYFNDNDPKLFKFVEALENRIIELMQPGSAVWSENPDNKDEDLSMLRRFMWRIAKSHKKPETHAKYGSFLKLEIYDKNKDWAWTRNNGEAEIDFSYLCHFDPTENKMVGVGGTYTVDCDAPYVHLLNKRFGLKMLIGAGDVVPHVKDNKQRLKRLLNQGEVASTTQNAPASEDQRSPSDINPGAPGAGPDQQPPSDDAEPSSKRHKVEEEIADSQAVEC